MNISAKPDYLIINQIEHFPIKETTSLIMELKFRMMTKVCRILNCILQYESVH